MSEKELTFNDLPSAVAYLIQSVDEIKAMLKHLPPRSSVNEEWLDVEHLYSICQINRQRRQSRAGLPKVLSHHIV